MKMYSFVYSLIYGMLMAVYKMNLMALHLISHINNSQFGLELVGRCRTAAKSLVAIMTAR